MAVEPLEQAVLLLPEVGAEAVELAAPGKCAALVEEERANSVQRREH